jgi:hypothetical protein
MVITISSDNPNTMSSAGVRLYPADKLPWKAHTRAVVKAAQKTQRDFRHTWFLREWAEQARLTQADLQRAAGWSKAKASDVWNGQQYNQSIIDELAPILMIRPFEILLHPDEAFLIRRMRDASPRAVTSEIAPQTPRIKATRAT